MGECPGDCGAEEGAGGAEDGGGEYELEGRAAFAGRAVAIVDVVLGVFVTNETACCRSGGCEEVLTAELTEGTEEGTECGMKGCRGGARVNHHLRMRYVALGLEQRWCA